MGWAQSVCRGISVHVVYVQTSGVLQGPSAPGSALPMVGRASTSQASTQGPSSVRAALQMVSALPERICKQ